eukprot:884538-Pleurochrysis_carterae.AAC.1
MQRDAAKLLNLPAKVASPWLQLTYFQSMIGESSHLQFRFGDDISNGQMTNGFVDRGSACSLRRSPFSPQLEMNRVTNANT